MNDTPTPAYGEPWKPLQPDLIYDSSAYWMADAFNPSIRDRIIACVNACAGMADPAAEIANLKMELDASCNAEHLRQVRDENKAMREAIREAHDAIEECATKLARWHGLYPSELSSDDYAAGLNAQYAFAKLQLFLP